MPPGESKEILDRELEAAHRAGLTDLEIVERATIKSYDTGMGPANKDLPLTEGDMIGWGKRTE